MITVREMSDGVIIAAQGQLMAHTATRRGHRNAHIVSRPQIEITGPLVDIIESQLA